MDQYSSPPKKMTRPAISQTQAEKLFDYIREGINYTRACAAVGISYKSFQLWKKKGEDEDPVYQDFYLGLRRAEFDLERRLVKRIESAGEDPKNWKANQFLLESRFPNDYRKPAPIEYSSSDDDDEEPYGWGEFSGDSPEPLDK